MDLNTQPGNLPVIASIITVYVSSPLHSVVWSEQTKYVLLCFYFYYESNMLSEMLVTLTAHLILVKTCINLLA